MRQLAGVLKYVKGYWNYAILNIVSNIISVIFSLFSLAMAIPFLNVLFDDAGYKKILSQGAPQLSLRHALDYLNYYFAELIEVSGKSRALLIITVFVIVIFFVKNLFRYLALYYIAPVRNGVVKDLRNAIYKKTLDLPLSYYSDERKGDIMSRITTDVQEIEWSILTGLEMIFRDPLNIIFFLVSLLLISAKLTLLVLILLPLTAGLISLVGKTLKRSSAKAKEKLSLIFSIMEETLSGLRIIKGFNAEEHQRKKFFAENDHFTALMVKTYRRIDLSSPLSEFLGAVIMMVVMYLGGMMVLTGASLRGADFITYLLVFSQIIPPAKSITTAYYNVQRGMASIERINKILHADISIQDSSRPEAIQKFEKEIEYKDVSFAYIKGDIGWALRNVNLKIEKGKTIALVGQSGSGKTTLADLLPRFYDATEGSILIDGRPIGELKISDLRRLMGIVTQESILFNDTVLNNIAFGMENVQEADVIAAAKIANAHEFILQMPLGYQTNIGDRGGKMSGGQRQRISIARAVLKNPPILILDEATSALDTESERLVQDALNKLMKNRTSVVIAHRLSTIQHADEIIVLQKSEIVERGNHQQLLLKNGAYKRLYDLQSFV
jgi:ABC-type multidrug transport system fused ATPase/permease subunit